MAIVDNQKSWVGILNGDKCANCYYFGTICLNCSDVQNDPHSEYDLEFGLMNFEEFKESANLEFLNFTYKDFMTRINKGNLCYESESETDEDNHLSNDFDVGEVSESDFDVGEVSESD